MKIEDLGIAVLSERPIAFHSVLAQIGGGVAEGLFMSQLLRWTIEVYSAEEWVDKTRIAWELGDCLNRREQETARRRWKALGVLEEKREGRPRRVFYRVNVARLQELGWHP